MSRESASVIIEGPPQAAGHSSPMRRFSISALALLLAFSCASAQSSAPKGDEACRSFVQRFYDWHVAHGSNFERTLKLKRSVLSPELGNALAADLAAAKKNADEIVGLDFDPFLNSQDPSPRYRVEKTRLNSGRCFADVHGVPSDRKEKPDVTAELQPKNGSWAFVNFHYGSENGPANENLLSILRELKRDREKPRKQ